MASRRPDLSEIQAVLSESKRGPLKAKELARELDVDTPDYQDFRDFLKELETEGELYRNRRDAYAIPDQIHLAVGELSVTRKGDGFVRLDEAGQDDVFVRERHLESALDGDRVAVRIERRPSDRNPEGRVVKILERGRPSLVGRYHRSRRFGFVRPLDQKIPRDIVIPEDGAGGASEGDVVVVEIDEFGSSKRNAVGTIRTILGRMDDPGVDVLSILHGHGLPHHFPEEVEANAETATRFMDEPGQRVDRTDLLVFTIDPADARDHDDALSITPVSKGVWEVGIHIADVSHFVREGSRLDMEALSRATSVYLVDQVVPMLPHRLSSDLCSLREGAVRFALSLFVVMDEQGRVRSHSFERTRIQTQHGLHYSQVQEVLDKKGSVSSEVDDAIRRLDQLAKVLRKKRAERGSLDFDLPEARVLLDAEGAPIEIQKVVHLDSHRLVEDFMLLANEVVARDCVERRLPVPFRVHEPPSADRLELLESRLAPFGHGFGNKGVTHQKLQKILATVRGRPEETLISQAVLRSMSRARYHHENMGHFGLASEAYTHFTSPIRRYPDLLVHRVVSKALIDGDSVPDSWRDSLEEVCEQASAQEKKAQQAERDSVDMKKIEFMRRHLGDDFEGTISGVTSFGFFVVLDRVYVDGLVHVSTLEDDYYTFVEEQWALVGKRRGGRYRLGDRVRVRVARADKEERKIDFQLLEHLGGDRGQKSDGSRSKGSGGKGSGRKRGKRRGS